MFFSVKKPEPKKNKVRMGVILNNETVKEIANIGAGFNNINDSSNKKEATVFVVLDMHPGLMNPTETLGKYYSTNNLMKIISVGYLDFTMERIFYFFREQYFLNTYTYSGSFFFTFIALLYLCGYTSSCIYTILQLIFIVGY